MSNSYSIPVNVDFVRLMMIVVELWIVFVGYHLCHDFYLVINALLNHVYRVMHYPDLNYRDVLFVHIHHRLDSMPAVIHDDYSMANKIHRMRSLVAVIAANVVVPDLLSNLFDLLVRIVLLNHGDLKITFV